VIETALRAGGLRLHDGSRVPGEESPMDADQPLDLADEEGGDPVCWAHLVCPECGAIITEGHRAGCQATPRRNDDYVLTEIIDEVFLPIVRGRDPER
jgi:hypothetical protein